MCLFVCVSMCMCICVCVYVCMCCRVSYIIPHTLYISAYTVTATSISVRNTLCCLFSALCSLLSPLCSLLSALCSLLSALCSLLPSCLITHASYPTHPLPLSSSIPHPVSGSSRARFFRPRAERPLHGSRHCLLLLPGGTAQR
jgi:hypothetical protein